MVASQTENAGPLVVFDFDGTIADSMIETLAVYNREAGRLGVPALAVADLPGLRAMRPWEVLATLRIPMWKVPLILRAVRRGMRERLERVSPFAGIDAAVRRLCDAGARCAIVSSNSRENVTRFITRHAIGEFALLQCGASAFGKASRLRGLLKSVAAEPRGSYYVGDEVRDVVAAMRSVAVTWGYSSRCALEAEQPDVLVDTREQLGGLLSSKLS